MKAIKEYQGKRVEVYPMPFVMRAFTIGLMWRGRVYHVNPSKISNVMLGHELVHVEQWKTNKNFYLKYFLIWLRLALTFKRAYSRHPMELEARILGASFQGWKFVSKNSYREFWDYVNYTDIEISKMINDAKRINE